VHAKKKKKKNKGAALLAAALVNDLASTDGPSTPPPTPTPACCCRTMHCALTAIAHLRHSERPKKHYASCSRRERFVGMTLIRVTVPQRPLGSDLSVSLLLHT
jgi:hypothetical protein